MLSNLVRVFTQVFDQQNGSGRGGGLPGASGVQPLVVVEENVWDMGDIGRTRSNTAPDIFAAKAGGGGPSVVGGLSGQQQQMQPWDMAGFPTRNRSSTMSVSSKGDGKIAKLYLDKLTAWHLIAMQMVSSSNHHPWLINLFWNFSLAFQRVDQVALLVCVVLNL